MGFQKHGTGDGQILGEDELSAQRRIDEFESQRRQAANVGDDEPVVEEGREG